MTLNRSDIRLANEFNIFDNVSDLESFCVEDEISDAAKLTVTYSNLTKQRAS
jgi:hypothetical protein